jgi:hypothetical protein
LIATVAGRAAVQLAVALAPPLRNLLGLAALAPADWARVGLGALAPLVVTEAFKRAERAHDQPAPEPRRLSA